MTEAEENSGDHLQARSQALGPSSPIRSTPDDGLTDIAAIDVETLQLTGFSLQTLSLGIKRKSKASSDG